MDNQSAFWFLHVYGNYRKTFPAFPFSRATATVATELKNGATVQRNGRTATEWWKPDIKVLRPTLRLYSRPYRPINFKSTQSTGNPAHEHRGLIYIASTRLRQNEAVRLTHRLQGQSGFSCTKFPPEKRPAQISLRPNIYCHAQY